MPEPGSRIPRPLSAMLDRLPPPQLEELEAVLGAILYTPATPAQVRLAELGALRAMLERAVSVAGEANRAEAIRRFDRSTYEKQRSACALPAERLVERYGSWRKACRAAAALGPRGEWLERGPGGVRPWPHPSPGKRRPQNYGREEILAAVHRCQQAIGRFPSSSAYYDWVRRQRRRARLAGAEPARLPTQRSVERHFNSWSEVRVAAIASSIQGAKR